MKKLVHLRDERYHLSDDKGRLRTQCHKFSNSFTKDMKKVTCLKCKKW